MHIKVLQHHIDEGIKGDPNYCPIALAIREQKPAAEHVVVHGWTIIDGYWWDTPHEAMGFIAQFDSHDPDVRPFEFDLKGEGNPTVQLIPGSRMYDSAAR